jgi:hypothetical protein
MDDSTGRRSQNCQVGSLTHHGATALFVWRKLMQCKFILSICPRKCQPSFQGSFCNMKKMSFLQWGSYIFYVKMTFWSVHHPCHILPLHWSLVLEETMSNASYLVLKALVLLAVYLLYSFISVDKHHANDAEHHLWANALQPGTAAKVSSFFFLFMSLMLTWERDLVFSLPSAHPRGRIRFIRLESLLPSWRVSG